MANSLSSVTPGSSYPSLLKVGDNGPITSSNKVISDGNGNEIPLQASSTKISFTTDPGASGAPKAANWDYTTGRFGIGLTGPTDTLHVLGSFRTQDPSTSFGLISSNSGRFFTLTPGLDSTSTNFGIAKRYAINGALVYNIADWANGATPAYIDATKPNSGAGPLALIMDGYGGSPGFHFYAPANQNDTIARNRMHIGAGGDVWIGVQGGSGGTLTVRGRSNTSADTVLNIQNSSATPVFSVKADGSQTWATGATSAAGATATYKIPVTIGGQVYYLLASL